MQNSFSYYCTDLKINNSSTTIKHFLAISYELLLLQFQLFSSYAFQVIMNAVPSVDTFFLLSGCLLAYLTLKELDKTKGKLNWIMYYVHRYIRSFLTAYIYYVLMFPNSGLLSLCICNLGYFVMCFVELHKTFKLAGICTFIKISI